MSEKRKEIKPDVLVISTGAAGLRATIEARRYGAEVLVVDKSLIGVNNNTVFAGGRLKAALPGILDESMSYGQCRGNDYTIRSDEAGEPRGRRLPT